MPIPLTQDVAGSVTVAAYAIWIATPILTAASVWGVLRYRVGKLEAEHREGISKLGQIDVMANRIGNLEKSIDRIDREREDERRDDALWKAAFDSKVSALDSKMTAVQTDVSWIRQVLTRRDKAQP
jgi:hypothetical protein